MKKVKANSIVESVILENVKDDDKVETNLEFDLLSQNKSINNEEKISNDKIDI